MTSPDSAVTICITPRERFSCAVDSLRDIVRNTEPGYRLVYIDANSPPGIGAELAEICAINGFTYRREERYLAPNQARNLALAHANTPFVAFVDNDLFVQPGWLEALVRCARETGAWAVGPVVLEGIAALQVVHMAGGDLAEDRCGDYNRVQQQHRYMKQPLLSVRGRLVREPVGAFEFHCVLVRTDAFGERQFLDEGFLSAQEHLDLAREIRLAGGEVYFEPTSIVRYDNARPFKDYDREFFELRWSPEWTEQSIEHTRAKWGLAPDDASLEKLSRWTEGHRQLFETSQKPWLVETLPIVLRRTAGAWLRRLGVLPSRAAS